MTRVVVLAALLAGAPALAQSAAVERCVKADAEFDYEQAVQECALAAADPNTTTDEKITVFRLLGIAHTALKQDARAETWFIRLLVLDPGHTFDESASPVYREAFAKAQKRFADEGRVTVSAGAVVETGAAGARAVSFELQDALGRVADARLRVTSVSAEGARGTPVDVALARTPGSGPGAWALKGEVPDPGPPPSSSGPYAVEFQLVLLSAKGDEIAPDPALPPSSFAGGRQGESGGDNTLLYAGVGGVAAVAVVVIVVAAGVGAVAVTCFTTDLCGGGETTSRVAISPAQ